MKCKNCGKELDGSYKPEWKDTEFCSTFCARSYSAKSVDDNETKKAECVDCGKEIWIKKRASPKTCKCVDCKKRSFCKVCGQEKPCLRPDVCRKWRIFPTLAKYFGFDMSKKGTIDIYEEFDRVKNIVYEDYWEKKLSLPEMVDKYGHYNSWNFVKILKSLEIESRNWSEANINALETGRKEVPTSQKYIYGWHTTWNNKEVFYRSSYELEYAQKLDEQQIDYEMEGLRIVYWDSQLLRQRIAIPDFYLPRYRTIIEVKSDWTYNKQNMKDRSKAYKEHGYICKLVLEGEEFILT